MLEFLENGRIFFYEKKVIDIIIDKNKYESEYVEWKLIRRMKHLGLVEKRLTDILEVISEDFIYYIDINAATQTYIIRNMS